MRFRLALSLAILCVAVAAPVSAQFELCTLRGTAQNERLGSAVGGASVSGGGGRWVVGASGATVFGLPAQTGAVHILSWSATTGCSGAWFGPVPGSATGDEFGARLATGPGGMIVVGAPGQGAPVGAQAGAIWRIDPATGLGTVIASGAEAGCRAGTAIAWLGDLDLDGFPDYGMGAPRGHWLGCAWNSAYRGRIDLVSEQPAPRTLATAFGSGWCSGPYVAFAEDLGWNVSPLGDVNNNGRTDFLIGSYASSQVYVCEVDTAGALVNVRPADGGPSQFGRSACALGDVNNDGRPDYAAGAPAAREVRVIDGATGAVLRTWVGLREEFGARLAPVGDQDGDQIADLLIAAPGALNGTGEVYLYSVGRGHLLAVMRGERAGDRFGDAVAGVPDLTGDGRQELSVGAPDGRDATGTLNAAGYARLFTLDGSTPGAQLFGNGCVSTSSHGPEPWIGTPLGIVRPGNNFAFGVSRCMPNRPAVLVVDFAPASPIPLGGLVPCLSSCSLLVGSAVNVTTTSASRTTATTAGLGHAEFSFAVPANPIFGSTRLYAQWYAVDPGPSPLCGGMTRGLRL